MTYEDKIKAEIKERLKNAPRYHLYCCVCGLYLCCSTRYQRITVHFDCRKGEIKYYNTPPETTSTAHT